jgi:hypothetical protein
MYKKQIILTGAGFTKNFNGLLAREVYKYMHNNDKVHQNKKLHTLFNSVFDFEQIYYEVISNKKKYDDTEINIMYEVLMYAFKHIEKSVCESPSNNNDLINRYKVNRLLLNMKGNKNEKGFIFTLNQDLFIEKNLNTRPNLLGINNYKYYDKYDAINGIYIKPNSIDITKKISYNECHEFNYIKLHGSCDWVDKKNQNFMIIGKNKDKDIENHPLLDSYRKIFKEILFSGKMKLLIFGYGFGDKHINKLISEAADNHSLEIYMITPQSREELNNYLIETNEGILINKNIVFCDSPLDIYPPNNYQEANEVEKNLNARFFEDSFNYRVNNL